MGTYDLNCKTYRLNSGLNRISPDPAIYKGKYWVVEHNYSSQICGWLVVTASRHVKASYEFTHDEFTELGGILERTSKLLYATLTCEKEYSIFCGEVEWFNHVHYYVIVISSSLLKEYRWTKIFSLPRGPEKSIPKEEIADLCDYLTLMY